MAGRPPHRLARAGRQGTQPAAIVAGAPRRAMPGSSSTGTEFWASAQRDCLWEDVEHMILNNSADPDIARLVTAIAA